MLCQSQQSLVIDIVASAQLDPPQHLAAGSELGDTFGGDLFAAGEIDALCLGTVCGEGEQGCIRDISYIGEIDGNELRSVLEDLDKGSIGDVDASGKGESLETCACGHHEEELILELIGEQGEVETTDKVGIGEKLFGFANDSDQFEERGNFEERRTVPEQLDTVQAPGLANEEGGKQIGRIEDEVFEDVEEDLVREVGGGAEWHVLKDPCAVGGSWRGGYEGATTREADGCRVKGAFDCGTSVGFGVGVFDGGEVGKVFLGSTIIGLRSAGG